LLTISPDSLCYHATKCLQLAQGLLLLTFSTAEDQYLKSKLKALQIQHFLLWTILWTIRATLDCTGQSNKLEITRNPKPQLVRKSIFNYFSSYSSVLTIHSPSKNNEHEEVALTWLICDATNTLLKILEITKVLSYHFDMDWTLISNAS